MAWQFNTSVIKNPIRMYGPNDPYYWEVDNLPLEDLLENCARLQYQLLELEALDFDQFATAGSLESSFVKIEDFNNRKLESLEEDFDFVGENQPYHDDLLVFKGIYHSPGGTDQGGRWQSISRDSRRDLFPKTLPDLHDVDPNLAPANGEVLKWNSSNSQWETGIDIHYEDFNALLDCEVVNPQLDDVLVYGVDSNNQPSWRNGYPTNLPTFDNFSNPNDGDVLAYGGQTPGSPHFEPVGLGGLPNQTTMFDGEGAPVIAGVNTIDTDSGLDADVSWMNSPTAYKAAGGYTTEEFTLPNTVAHGSAFNWSTVANWVHRPRYVYIQGISEAWPNPVNAATKANAATLELAFFDSNTSQKSCNYVHVNSAKHKESTELNKHWKTFSAWVPIFWDGTTAKLATGIYKDNRLNAGASHSICKMHVRILGART